MTPEITPLVKGTLQVVKERSESGADRNGTQLSTTTLIIDIMRQRIHLEDEDAFRLAQNLRHTNSYLRLHPSIFDPWVNGRIASVVTTRASEVAGTLDAEEEPLAMGTYNHVLSAIESYNPRLRSPQRTLAFVQFLDINDG